MVFVNKMDRTGANFMAVVGQIKERLGHNPIVMQIPIGAEDNFTGIIDLVENVAHMFTDDMGTFNEEPIPADYADIAAEYREKLIEYATEADEELMNKYLEEGDLSRKLQKLAVDAYKAVGCRGVTRVDFRVSPLGRCYVLELNTSPGFTSHSLVPKSGIRTGLTFAGVCDRILQSADYDK